MLTTHFPSLWARLQHWKQWLQFEFDLFVYDFLYELFSTVAERWHPELAAERHRIEAAERQLVRVGGGST